MSIAGGWDAERGKKRVQGITRMGVVRVADSADIGIFAERLAAYRTMARARVRQSEL